MNTTFMQASGGLKSERSVAENKTLSDTLAITNGRLPRTRFSIATICIPQYLCILKKDS
jgi:hypothetical protein